MKTAKGFGRILPCGILVFFPAVWIWADGGYFTKTESVAISADQRAIIIKDDDQISMTFSTGYIGDGQDFGWIIPAPPSIEHVFEAGEDGETAFDILDKRTAPVVMTITSCFPAGTEVLTADGPQAIEKIIPGTKVHSYDLSKRDWVFKEVLGRQTHQYEGDMITVRLGNVVIHATGNHPFYVQRGEQLDSRPLPEDVPIGEQQITDQGRWVEARDLLPGDVLLGTSDEEWVITDVASRYERTKVYNLSVEGNHDYAVHRAGILVHNKGAIKATETEVLLPVYGRVTLEHYEVSILGAAAASALSVWLQQNDYKIDPSAKKVFDTYINKDWVFIAVKLNPGEKRRYDNEFLPPITIQYQSEHLDYPLRISSASSTNTVKITLFVIAESTVTSSNFPTTELNYTKHNQQWIVPNKYIETCIQNTLAEQEGGFVVMWSGKACFSDDERKVINRLVQSPFRESRMMYLTRFDSRIKPTDMVDDVGFLLDSQPREHSIHVESYTGYGSELLLAARNGEIGSVRKLLETGKDVNEKGSADTTALIWASGGGHSEIVQILLDAGANVNAVDTNGRTALTRASGGGHSEIVQILLDAGADVNVRDKNGWTALTRAAWVGHAQVVKILLDAGADVNAEDNFGYTALVWAVREGHSEVVQILMDAGAEE